jgi:hypothetical protein
MTDKKPKLNADEGAIKEIRSWYWEEWEKAKKEGFEQGKLAERERIIKMFQKANNYWYKWLKSQLKEEAKK